MINTVSVKTQGARAKILNYWIVALPREDMEHCIKIGTFGLNKKVAGIAPGDKIACCVSKEKPWKLIALAEVTSELYTDNKRIFKKEGHYFYRFDLKGRQLPAKEEPDFQALLPDLSFITHLVYWPVYFKGGIKRIEKHDWELIAKSVTQTA